MSDRVTKAEIEDVLSSVRRLVSLEERRDEGVSARPEETSERRLVSRAAGGQAAPSDTRLILSSSLRVTQPGRATSADSGDPKAREPEAPETDASKPSARPPTGPEPPDVLGLAKWQVETGHPSPDAPPDARAEQRAEAKTLEGAAPGRKELEARIAEVEAAVAARDDQWEPDGSEPEAGATRPIPSVPWLRPTGDTDPDPNAPDAQARAETAAPARPVSAPGDPPDDPPDDPWFGEEAVLDEAALRDLVSEIVRQELQGRLGERITRNVHKLVRQEVHRVLMDPDLDGL